MQPSSNDSLRSLERVYRDHLHYVWWTLRALGVVESAIDDAAQDVFIVVHRRLGEFEGRASMKTWLYQIARRVALRYRSRTATDAARTFELPELEAAEDLDAAVDRATAAEVLRSFIATLDEDRRRVFVLAELWEMRGREIADALDVNANTVYARLRSARTDLDRMARRLHAKDAPTLARTIRTQRPSERARQQTWAALAAKLSTGAGAATLGTVAAGAGALKWGVVGGLTAAVLLVTVAAIDGPTGGPAAPAAPAAAPLDPVAAPTSKGPLASPAAGADGGRAADVDVQRVPEAAVERDPQPHVAVDRPEVPSSGRNRAARAERSPASPKPSLDEEVERVKQIRRAVARADRQTADAAIDAYRREVGKGVLRLEVDALSVELACRVSADDAAARLRHFERQRPDAHLARRVEKTCAGKIGPQKPAGADTVSR